VKKTSRRLRTPSLCPTKHTLVVLLFLTTVVAEQTTLNGEGDEQAFTPTAFVTFTDPVDAVSAARMNLSVTPDKFHVGFITLARFCQSLLAFVFASKHSLYSLFLSFATLGRRRRRATRRVLAEPQARRK
jgi:hypothetical protein